MLFKVMSIDWASKLRERKEEKDRQSRVFNVLVSGDKEFLSDGTSYYVANGELCTCTNTEYVFSALNKLLQKKIEDGMTIELHTTDNSGSDKIAIEYATHNGYDIYIYEADWDSNGNRAGWIRNEDMMLELALKPNKAAILFWDGENKFTENLIFLCYCQSITLRIYNYKTHKWLSKEAVEEVQRIATGKQMNYM